MAGKPIPVADQAVAQAALTALVEAMPNDFYETGAVAAYLIDSASRVRFQPSTRQLVLTFDLAMGETTE
jgi:hypothetical protein